MELAHRYPATSSGLTDPGCTIGKEPIAGLTMHPSPDLITARLIREAVWSDMPDQLLVLTRPASCGG